MCKVKGCNNQATRRGWCNMHYIRWQRHGNPVAGKTFDGAPSKFLCEKVLTYIEKACLIWPFSKNAKGYATIKVDGKTVTVSRIVCEHVYGPAPTSTHQAAHSCKKNKGCVNKKHLRWATPSENQQDRLLHGTHNRGEHSGKAKLTKRDVMKIRILTGKKSFSEIAKKFDVCAVTIADITYGRTWSWLK
jgi:hypothetical protein